MTLWEKVFGLVAAVLTLAVALLGVRTVVVSDEKNGLQETVNSVKRQNSTLTAQNDELRKEVDLVTADRDRWKAQAQDGTANPTPGPTASEYDYEFEFADRTFYDFDTRKAATTGGANFEVELNFGRFFHGETYDTWNGVLVVYVKDSDASYAGCEKGTDIQAGEVAHLNEVEQNESICIRTSGGKWATLKMLDVQSSSSGLGAGNISFGVRLLAG